MNKERKTIGAAPASGTNGAGIRPLIGASFLLAGLYHELSCALISGLLLIWLIRRGERRAPIIRYNAAVLAAACISTGYTLSCFWSVDWGLALWGAAKYLPLPLMALCLLQISAEDRAKTLEDIPWIGAAMVPISFALQQVPILSGYFSVSGRLAGFFQYPNTFACFLLLGLEILLLGRETAAPVWLRCAAGASLVFGILQSGSRTVFLLAIVSVPVCLWLCIRRKAGKAALPIVGAAVAGGVLLSAACGAFARAGTEHIMDLSTRASTLLGRLLYWKDALPFLLKHPFGVGYLGYYLAQGSFQTGVYSVRWIHNDLLQLLLDVGWIPAAAAIWAVVRGILSKNVTALQRAVLLTLLAHCMMDFDLEFVAMYFVVLLCLDWDAGRAAALPGKKALAAAAAVLTAIALYLGIGSSLTYLGRHEAAVKWYPWNTLSQVQMLPRISDARAMGRLADEILRRDPYIALAWDARAQAAYSEGDFGAVIEAKRRAMELNPYSAEEYADYFEKLAIGEQLYRRAGDTASADVCHREILSIQERIDAVLAKTDPLAWKIADQPELTMPPEFDAYIWQNAP